ncbi:MAG TPA: nucleotidyl transferase AbiEii/AbiGii toxin family protein [Planctomycetota bacterium]|nr:nucleotidyl transferase AbiEii/AbiGii toxin family protein [Planctomycetota bacterium]
MGSSRSALTPLQRAFLERFFASVKGFYLTGGGALGNHYGHRLSLDLDLFTREEIAFPAARASLPVIAGELGAKAQIVSDSPAFLR